MKEWCREKSNEMLRLLEGMELLEGRPVAQIPTGAIKVRPSIR